MTINTSPFTPPDTDIIEKPSAQASTFTPPETDPIESDSSGGFIPPSSDPIVATLDTPETAITPPSSMARRAIADPGVSVAKGIVGLPKAAAGMLDIATTYNTLTTPAAMIGKVLSGQPILQTGQIGKLVDENTPLAKWQDKIGELHTPEAKAEQATVSAAFDKGVIPGVVSAIKNPSTIANTFAESLPSMAAGGFIGKGVGLIPGASKILAGAIGELAITAGQSQEQIRAESDTGLTTAGQTVIAAGSGALTSLVGVLGGKMAERLGIADVDTLMAGGSGAKRTLMNVVKGMVSEGLLEELPQSLQEQISQNVATGKKWDDGIAESGAMGALVGGIMGAGANLAKGAAKPPPVVKPTPDLLTPDEISAIKANPSISSRLSEIIAYNAQAPKDKQISIAEAARLMISEAMPPTIPELPTGATLDEAPAKPTFQDEVAMRTGDNLNRVAIPVNQDQWAELARKTQADREAAVTEAVNTATTAMEPPTRQPIPTPAPAAEAPAQPISPPANAPQTRATPPVVKAASSTADTPVEQEGNSLPILNAGDQLDGETIDEVVKEEGRVTYKLEGGKTIERLISKPPTSDPQKADAPGTPGEAVSSPSEPVALPAQTINQQTEAETGNVSKPEVIEPTSIDKDRRRDVERELYPPGSGGSPGDNWTALIRVNGMAWARKPFATKAEAEAFMADTEIPEEAYNIPLAEGTLAWRKIIEKKEATPPTPDPVKAKLESIKASNQPAKAPVAKSEATDDDKFNELALLTGKSVESIKKLYEQVVSDSGAEEAAKIMDRTLASNRPKNPIFKGISVTKRASELTDTELDTITASDSAEMKERNIELSRYQSDPRFDVPVEDHPGAVKTSFKAVRDFLRDGTLSERGQKISKIADMVNAKLNNEMSVSQYKSAGHILRAIETGKYNSILHPDNRASRAVFTELTGVKLPSGLKATAKLFTGTPFTMQGASTTEASTPKRPIPKSEKLLTPEVKENIDPLLSERSLEGMDPDGKYQAAYENFLLGHSPAPGIPARMDLTRSGNLQNIAKRNVADAAETAGARAFLEGKPRVPRSNGILPNMNLKMIDSWLRGWDQANIAAPMPEAEVATAPAKTPKATEADVAAMSDDDIDALLDDAKAEAFPEKKPKAEPTKTEAIKAKLEATRAPRSSDAAKQNLKDAKKNAAQAFDAAAQAIRDILGGGGRLGMGVPLDFDAETYAKVKPHLRTMWESSKAVGHDLKQFAVNAYKALGEAAKPYLKKFMDEIRANTATDKSPAIDELSSQIQKILKSDESGQVKAIRVKQLANEQGLSIKDMQERIEVELVRMSDEIAKSDATPQDRFSQLVELYRKQPTLSARTSTSIENQAYSTPAPLSFAIGYALGVTPDMAIYDPTGGNGMLLIGGDISTSWANELNDVRVQGLKDVGVGEVTQNDAITYVPNRKFPVVKTNPPFGTIDVVNYNGYKITKLEHIIALKALEAMKDDGKAAIILGAKMKEGETGKGAQWIFENYLYANYNVVDNFEVEGDLYAKQGAAWPVRVLLVDGRKSAKDAVTEAPKVVDRLKTWEDTWSRSEGLYNELESRRQSLDAGKQGTVPSGAPGIVPENGGTVLDGAGKPIETTGGRGGARGNRGRKPTPTPKSGNGSVEPVTGKTPERPVMSGQPPAESNAGRKPDARVEVGNTGRNGSPVSTTARSEAGSGKPEPRSVPKPTAVAGTEFQIPYEAQSSANPFGTLMPKNIAAGVHDSLKSLKDRVGNIDEFLADRLNMDVNILRSVLAAEQIDGAAMAIDQIENGGALVIGDQTGIGKGRQAAAVIRYAIIQGKIPVFFTKDPKLFSDMYGDLKDINTDIKPLIFGDPEKASIVDSKGSVIHKAPAKAGQDSAMKKIDASGMKDAGYDSIFVTYSQINQVNNRQRFLEEMARNDDVILVLDEAHEAAGDSNNSMQAAFMSGGIVQKGSGAKRTMTIKDGLLRSAGTKKGRGGVLYLSATYAKRPENMAVYFRTDLNKSAQKFSSIVDAIKRGGVALQQAVSEALAKVGQYIRRERDFSGTTYDMKYIKVADEKELVNQIDDVTDVLSQIVKFSADIKELIAAQNVASTAMGQNAIDVAPFASIVHNQVSQLLLAAKADAVVEEIIETNKQGQKPVVALMNTMEAFLSQYATEKGIQPGQRIKLGWTELLQYALSRTLRASEKLPNGDTIIHTMTPGELGVQSEYDEIMAAAASIAPNLPVSPIDYIIQRAKAAGVNVGELTGRTSGIEYDAGSMTEGVYKHFKKANKNSLVNGFNDGSITGLLLNASGSTGLSIHASTRFKDQKPRHMIIAQPALDINVFVQTLGRILRTGMVPGGAHYSHLILPLQAEMRPAVVAAKKMKSLNANTTAEADNAMKIEAEDFMNKYGDEVVGEYLEEHPDLQGILDLPVAYDADDTINMPEGTAQKFTGRMSLIPDSDQKKAYAEIVPAYREKIAQVKAMGEYDLEIVVHDDWDGVKNADDVLSPGTDESSIFTASVRLQKWEVKDNRHVPTGEEMVRELEKNHQGPDGLKSEWRAFQNKVDSRFDEEKSKIEIERDEEQDPKKKDRISIRLHNLEDRESRWHITRNSISGIMMNAGDVATVRNNETLTRNDGMLVGVKFPKISDGSIRVSPSSFKFKFMLNSPGGVAHFSASQITPDKWSVEGSEKYVEDLRGGTGNSRYERFFVTGNPIAAYIATGGSGQMVRFKSREGLIVTGLQMPSTWTPNQLASDPRLELVSGKAVAKFLENHSQRGYRNYIPVEIANIANIQKDPRSWNGEYIISVAGARSTGGAIYLDPALRRITGDFNKAGSRMVARIEADKIAKVADRIMAITSARFKPVGSAADVLEGVNDSNGQKSSARAMSPELDNQQGEKQNDNYDNGNRKNPAEQYAILPDGRPVNSVGNAGRAAGLEREMADIRSRAAEEIRTATGQVLEVDAPRQAVIDSELATDLVDNPEFKRLEAKGRRLGFSVIPAIIKGFKGLRSFGKILINANAFEPGSVITPEQVFDHEVAHAFYSTKEHGLQEIAKGIDKTSASYQKYRASQIEVYTNAYETGGMNRLAAKTKAIAKVDEVIDEEIVCDLISFGGARRMGVRMADMFKSPSKALQQAADFKMYLNALEASGKFATAGPGVSAMSPEPTDARTEAEQRLINLLGLATDNRNLGREEMKGEMLDRMAAMREKLKAQKADSLKGAQTRANERTEAIRAKLKEEKAEAVQGAKDAGAAKLLKQAGTLGEMLKEFDGGTAAQKIAEGRMSLRAAVNKLIKATESEHAQARKELVEAINSKLPGIASQKLRQFLSMLTRSQISDKSMEKALSKIDAIAEKEQKRHLIAAVKAAYAKTSTSMRVNVLYRQRVKDLMEGLLLSKPTEATFEDARNLAVYMDERSTAGEEVTEINRHMARLIRALVGTPIADMPVSSLEDLFSQINRLGLIGRIYQDAKTEGYKASQDAAVASLAGSMKIEEHLKVKEDPFSAKGLSMVDKFRNKMAETSDLMKKWYVYHQPMDVVFDLLDGAKHYAGANYRLFKSRIDLAFSGFRSEMHSFESELADKIKELGLGKVEASRIQAYAYDQQDTGREKLLNTFSDGTKADDARVNAMIDAIKLTDNEMAFYTWARSKIEANRGAIEKVMNEVYNTELVPVKNYWPMMTDWDRTEKTANVFGLEMDENGEFVKTPETSGGLKKNVNASFTVKRKGAGDQILKMNAFHNLHKHIQDVNYYIHVGPTVKYLQEIANKPEYAEAVGGIGQRIVREYLDTMARQGGMNGSHILRWVDSIRNNIGVGTLGFRLSSILIQPSSFFDGAGMIGGRWAFKGALNATQKEWHTFIIENMTEIKDRVGGEWALREAELNSQIAKYGFWGLKMFDQLTATAIAAGAYEKNLHERGLEVDMSNPDPEAITYAQLAVGRTQTRSDYKDQPLAVTRGALMGGSRTLARAIYQFQSFSLNKFSFMIHDGIYSAIKNKEPARGVAIAAWTALAFLMEEGIRAGLRAAPGGSGDDNEPEDIAKAFLMDYLQVIPWFGSILSALQYNQFPAPVVKTISDTATGLKSMATSKTTEARQRGAARFAGGVGSMFGIPGSSQAAQVARNTIKSDPEEVTAMIKDEVKGLSRDTRDRVLFDKATKMRADAIKEGLINKDKVSQMQFYKRYRDVWKRLKDR